MIIISWDVGVLHLAYCVMSCVKNSDNVDVIEVLDWNEINLIEDDVLQLSCSGLQKGDKVCGKNSKYYLEPLSKGFCKTHLDQHKKFWRKKDILSRFKECDPMLCDVILKNNNKCNKKSQIMFDGKTYLCGSHHKSQYKKLFKNAQPKPIKNLTVQQYSTDKLQLTLINKLDEKLEHFSQLKIERVVIENQPAIKNPKMKSIANTLQVYFMIKGIVNKEKGLNLDLVQLMCPSNKLKVNNDNTVEVFKNNKNDKIKYKLTKALSIQYTKQLLSNDKHLLDHLSFYKKKDDLCDAYLQARYYLEIKSKLKKK